jgi:ABC-type transport system involved in multi-copper enzyme maturation permease subunit
VSRLVRSELLKLRTTRLLLWLGLLIVALIAFIVSTRTASTDTLSLVRQSEQRSIAETAALSIIGALIVGVVSTAGEYTRGTIDHTYLVWPRRGQVVAAKLLAGAITGVVLAAFAEAVTWPIAAAWVSSKPVPFLLWTHTILVAYLGVLAAGAIGGVIGVGLGALLRRQTAGIVLALLWLLVGEPVLAISGAQRFAPGHAIGAVADAGSHSSDMLAFWPGLLLALGYAAAFGAVGTIAVARSDVG